MFNFNKKRTDDILKGLREPTWKVPMNNQEPTRECNCCGWDDNGYQHEPFCHSIKPPKECCKESCPYLKCHTGRHGVVSTMCTDKCDCSCHSIKPPIATNSQDSYEVKDESKLTSQDLPEEECEVCKMFPEDGHPHEELSPEVGDFRWKDTKEKVKGEVLAKDYENWLETNAHNLECWNGEDWKSLVSPELSWEQIKKDYSQSGLFDNIYDEKELDEKVKSLLVKEREAGIIYDRGALTPLGQQQAFNSGRASMVEEAIKLIKEKGLHLGYKNNIVELLQALKNKE